MNVKNVKGGDVSNEGDLRKDLLDSRKLPEVYVEGNIRDQNDLMSLAKDLTANLLIYVMGRCGAAQTRYIP